MEKLKPKLKGPPIIIHDEIRRRLKTPLYYTMKAVSNGREDRYGHVGVKEYHLYISKKPPEEEDDCYMFSPCTLYLGNQLELKLFKGHHKSRSCAFLDKEKVRKLIGDNMPSLE